MFQTGRSYKVKVEVAPGQVGFGRVVVVDKQAGKIYVQFRTRSDVNQALPTGTRLWLVADALDNPFNGVWSAKVVGARMFSGQKAMELSTPKFQTVAQRRNSQRLPLNCPVRVLAAPGQEVAYEVRTFNISLSGVGLTMTESNTPEFEAGKSVDFVIETSVADIVVTARVIHSEYNWLHRRNTIGLEFVDINDEARLNLERLVSSIGATMPAEDEEVVTLSGLGAWLKSSRGDSKFVKGGQGERTTPEDAGSAQGADDGGPDVEPGDGNGHR